MLKLFDFMCITRPKYYGNESGACYRTINNYTSLRLAMTNIHPILIDIKDHDVNVSTTNPSRTFRKVANSLNLESITVRVGMFRYSSTNIFQLLLFIFNDKHAHIEIHWTRLLNVASNKAPSPSELSTKVSSPP